MALGAAGARVHDAALPAVAARRASGTRILPVDQAVEGPRTVDTRQAAGTLPQEYLPVGTTSLLLRLLRVHRCIMQGDEMRRPRQHHASSIDSIVRFIASSGLSAGLRGVVFNQQMV